MDLRSVLLEVQVPLVSRRYSSDIPTKKYVDEIHVKARAEKQPNY
jgi:hypothetical protein